MEGSINYSTQFNEFGNMHLQMFDGVQELKEPISAYCNQIESDGWIVGVKVEANGEKKVLFWGQNGKVMKELGEFIDWWSASGGLEQQIDRQLNHYSN